MGLLTQITGWVGMLLFLWAYYLVSFKKMDASGRNYQLINLAGALGVGANVLYHKAWPAFALEVVWVLIACVALFRILRKT